MLNHSLIGAGLPPQENSADASWLALSVALMRPPYCRSFLNSRLACAGNASPRTGQRISLCLLIGAEVASMRDYVAHQHASPLSPEHR